MPWHTIIKVMTVSLTLMAFSLTACSDLQKKDRTKTETRRRIEAKGGEVKTEQEQAQKSAQISNKLPEPFDPNKMYGENDPNNLVDACRRTLGRFVDDNWRKIVFKVKSQASLTHVFDVDEIQYNSKDDIFELFPPEEPEKFENDKSYHKKYRFAGYWKPSKTCLLMPIDREAMFQSEKSFLMAIFLDADEEDANAPAGLYRLEFKDVAGKSQPFEEGFVFLEPAAPLNIE